ncbi:MAG TPA: DUF3861 domain-containing protein [Lysobacter sp.]
MKAHRYRIHVEPLAQSEDAANAQDALSFEVANHDDLLAIVDRVSAATAFDRNDATALAVGLKLFTGVMLQHRHDPLFADVQPAMRAFIGNLKARVASTTATSTAEPPTPATNP